jgi:RNA polymerase sigma-70 factor, ECF subfamily
MRRSGELGWAAGFDASRAAALQKQVVHVFMSRFEGPVAPAVLRRRMRESTARAVVVCLPAGEDTGALVRRALGGDRSAEGLLYRRHAPEMLGTVSRLLRSTTAAEDVVQDGFLTAFNRLAQLKAPEQFRGWLLSIVVSLVRKRLRRQALLQWVGLETLDDVPLSAAAKAGSSVEARGELAVLDAVLKKLPTAHALAWSLRYVEGERLEDVASAMNKSLSTCKRYIAAAEKTVRAHVALEEP